MAEVKTEMIGGKYHATFKHGNQTFTINAFIGNKKEAKYYAKMLESLFKACPRCARRDITEDGDWKYCKCGATW